MTWARLAQEGLGTLWEFANETARLDKADLGHFCLRRGIYRQGTLGLLLVAFGRGGIMVWIIRLVAGSQIPRRVLVVFKKGNVFNSQLYVVGSWLTFIVIYHATKTTCR